MSMFRPSQTQTGAFFSILASVLIFILTAMALTSMRAAPRHPVSADLALPSDAGLTG